MAELLLKFTDNDGMDQIISVYKDRFTVGRHSENDLTIADGRLSRDHLKIERRAGAFFVSDLGSSNGTKLNGRVVAESVPVGNGDELDLGGVAIKVEIVESYSAAESDVESISKPAPFAATAAPANAAATGNGGIPTSVFYITPLIGIGILLIGVLAFFAF